MKKEVVLKVKEKGMMGKSSSLRDLNPKGLVGLLLLFL